MFVCCLMSFGFGAYLGEGSSEGIPFRAETKRKSEDHKSGPMVIGALLLILLILVSIGVGYYWNMKGLRFKGCRTLPSIPNIPRMRSFRADDGCGHSGKAVVERIDLHEVDVSVGSQSATKTADVVVVGDVAGNVTVDGGEFSSNARKSVTVTVEGSECTMNRERESRSTRWSESVTIGND